MKTVVYLCLVGVSYGFNLNTHGGSKTITAKTGVSNGFDFNLNTHGGSKTITDKTDVSPQCIQRAFNGTCDFYDCFEQRFPCGSSGYALRYGSKYCRRFKQPQFRSLFNTAGQVFLDRMSQYEIFAVLSWYKQQSISCSTEYVLRMVYNYQEEFLIESGFCDVALDNFDAFMKTIDIEDLNFELIQNDDISEALFSKFLKT